MDKCYNSFVKNINTTDESKFFIFMAGDYTQHLWNSLSASLHQHNSKINIYKNKTILKVIPTPILCINPLIMIIIPIMLITRMLNQL